MKIKIKVCNKFKCGKCSELIQKTFTKHVCFSGKQFRAKKGAKNFKNCIGDHGLTFKIGRKTVLELAFNRENVSTFPHACKSRKFRHVKDVFQFSENYCGLFSDFWFRHEEGIVLIRCDNKNCNEWRLIADNFFRLEWNMNTIKRIDNQTSHFLIV